MNDSLAAKLRPSPSPLPLPGRRRARGVFFGSLWLFFLIDPARDAWMGHPEPAWRVLLVAVLAAFAVIYVSGMWFQFPLGTPRFVWFCLTSLTALAAVLCLLAGESGMTAFVFVTVIGVFLQRNRFAAAWALLLVALTLVLPLVVPGWVLETSLTLGVAGASLAAFGVMQLLRRTLELQAAQEENRRLAVAEERLRFSRDLHDILGHSLTVITVKAELAGKLVRRAPERAEAEIADVERLSREALADVRETVSGYRGTHLAAELSRARRTLEAAGIAAELPQAVEDVPGERRELFGWVVREAVTNVVRHSSARRCVVQVAPTYVEVSDDGLGGSVASEGDGNGLSGLRERVAAAGGTLVAEPGADGGFVVRVEVPAS